jgi:hypothetical protein
MLVGYASFDRGRTLGALSNTKATTTVSKALGAPRPFIHQNWRLCHRAQPDGDRAYLNTGSEFESDSDGGKRTVESN